MSDNKWTQPAQPPPRMFPGQKEKDLVKQVNDELIERLVLDCLLPDKHRAHELSPSLWQAVKKTFYQFTFTPS